MKVAVIDIGTNTFNLLIAHKPNRRLIPLAIHKEFVFLGKGGINNNTIQDDAILRGLQTIKKFKKIADDLGATKIIAIATSAVRNAKNGNDFARKVKSLTGIDVKIINGNQEAEYIYNGAREATNLGDNPVLIMDVGGGSTEFIICDRYQVYWKKSIEVGAARLFEQFHKSDPILQQEIENIEAHLEKKLNQVIEKALDFEVETLIGSSGAFTSIAKMITHNLNEPEKLKNSTEYEFDLVEFENIRENIVHLNLEERVKIPGLIKERATMIVVGTVLVKFILEKLNIQQFKLARYALKEGVASEFLNCITH
ncbi:MAG: exopolyphosphatase [Flavobacteriales bacterium]|nr:exopolyphosphatase [Flavobacteriales bacterium]|tara:strand:- start:1 stop:933 length:933 start_codon:yes stop_codon:yes gene_type:complete